MRERSDIAPVFDSRTKNKKKVSFLYEMVDEEFKVDFFFSNLIKKSLFGDFSGNK